MARIPQQVARRGLEVVQPPNYPVLDATARAVQGFGDTISAVADRAAVAERAAERQEQVDRFNSLQGLSQLSAGLSGMATEALATAPDGTNYLAGMQQREQEAAQAFLATVPAHLRPEFEQRLEALRAENANTWAATEATRTRDYQRVVVTERLGNARAAIMERGPARLTAYRGEIEEFVNASTLPPAEKAERIAASRQALQQAATAHLSSRPPEEQIALLESPEFGWLADREARIKAADDMLSRAFVRVERTLANGDYALAEEGVQLAAAGNLDRAWYRRNEANLPPVLRNGFSRLAASPGGDGQRDPMVASALLERVLASPGDAQGTAMLALSDGLIDPADFTRVVRLASANVSEAGRAAMDGLIGLRPPQLSPGADRDDFDRAVTAFSDWLTANPTADEAVVAQRASATAASISGSRLARGRATVPTPAFATAATGRTYGATDQQNALRHTVTAAVLGTLADTAAGREAAKLRRWDGMVASA